MENVPDQFDREILKQITITKMPFGKYKDIFICDLPVAYLEWFLRKDGFPNGKLGTQLALVYEIKSNGLQEILEGLKKFYRK